jgi:hypothetical protein
MNSMKELVEGSDYQHLPADYFREIGRKASAYIKEPVDAMSNPILKGGTFG